MLLLQFARTPYFVLIFLQNHQVWASLMVTVPFFVSRSYCKPERIFVLFENSSSSIHELPSKECFLFFEQLNCVFKTFFK